MPTHAVTAHNQFQFHANLLTVEVMMLRPGHEDRILTALLLIALELTDFYYPACMHKGYSNWFCPSVCLSVTTKSPDLDI